MQVKFDTPSGVVRGNSRFFCRFMVDNGNLVIDLETFLSYKPSIAATLIKSLPEISPSSPLWEGLKANPSHNVCKNLGGTTIGFVTSGRFADSLGDSDICVYCYVKPIFFYFTST